MAHQIDSFPERVMAEGDDGVEIAVAAYHLSDANTLRNDVAEVQLAAQQLVAAFARNDTQAYFASFTEDATFVLHNLELPLRSRHAWYTQWTSWQAEGFSILDCVSSNTHVQVCGEVAIFFHDVDTCIQIDGQQSLLAERETIIFRRTSQGWLACHEHLSPRL